MSFFCPILLARRHGVEAARVDVPVTVISAGGEVDLELRLDTGAHLSTISEDEAARCGLPTGGVTVPVAGIGGQVTGRLVDVRCRFPPDALSRADGVDVDFQWVVIPGHTKTA